MEGSHEDPHPHPHTLTLTLNQAELAWEQKVRMQALKSGNQLRQNDLLQNEMGKG